MSSKRMDEWREKREAELWQRRTRRRLLRELTPQIGAVVRAVMVRVDDGVPVVMRVSRAERLRGSPRWHMAGIYDVSRPSFSARRMMEDAKMTLEEIA